jgi:hypothetical protein
MQRGRPSPGNGPDAIARVSVARSEGIIGNSASQIIRYITGNGPRRNSRGSRSSSGTRMTSRRDLATSRAGPRCDSGYADAVEQSTPEPMAQVHRFVEPGVQRPPAGSCWRRIEGRPGLLKISRGSCVRIEQGGMCSCWEGGRAVPARSIAYIHGRPISRAAPLTSFFGASAPDSRCDEDADACSA